MDNHQQIIENIFLDSKKKVITAYEDQIKVICISLEYINLFVSFYSPKKKGLRNTSNKSINLRCNFINPKPDPNPNPFIEY